jgi:hypothetical protein
VADTKGGWGATELKKQRKGEPQVMAGGRMALRGSERGCEVQSPILSQDGGKPKPVFDPTMKV